MELKKIIVKRYILKEKRRNYILKDVAILVDKDSKVTRENFNQEDDDYYMSSIEIERMYKEIEKKHEEKEKKKAQNKISST